MHKVASVLLLFFTTHLFAKEAITFKKDLVVNTHWYSYLIVLLLLLGILVVIAKYSKKVERTDAKFKIIERLTIHHKTQAYVLDYRGEQFILADNQNSIAIHPLKEVSNNE